VIQRVYFLILLVTLEEYINREHSNQDLIEDANSGDVVCLANNESQED